MSRHRRLLTLWAVVVIGLGVRAFADGLIGGASACRLEVWEHPVDINRAGIAELRVLPGIGPARAEAIVLERVRRGPFGAIGDLARVEGLGPETLAELAPWLRFDTAPAPGARR